MEENLARRSLTFKCARIEQVHADQWFSGCRNWTYVALVAGLAPPEDPNDVQPHHTKVRAMVPRLHDLLTKDLVWAPGRDVVLAYRCSRARRTVLRAQQVYRKLNAASGWHSVPEGDIAERGHWKRNVGPWPEVPIGPLLADIVSWAAGEAGRILSLSPSAQRGQQANIEALQAYLLPHRAPREEPGPLAHSLLSGVRRNHARPANEIQLSADPAFVTPGVRQGPPRSGGAPRGGRPVRGGSSQSPVSSPLARRFEQSASPTRSVSPTQSNTQTQTVSPTQSGEPTQTASPTQLASPSQDDGPQRPRVVEEPQALPPFPGLEAVGPGDEGWGVIDDVSVVDCAYSRFVMQENVGQWGVEFAIVVADVLEQVCSSVPQSRDRGLKWWLILPQLLFRQPRRGGRRGKGVMKARFAAFQDFRLRELLAWWKSDVEDRPPPRHRESSREDTVERALKFGRDRQVGKMVSLLVSAGLVDSNDPRVEEAMVAKYPQVRSQLPDFEVGSGNAGLELPALLPEMRKLKALRGVGPSGWRNEYLRVLAIEHDDNGAARVGGLVEKFASDMVNNRLPGWFYRATAAVRLVVLVKRPSLDPGVLPDLRPIGVGDSFMRVVTRTLVKSMQPVVQEAMWPLQVGVGCKGAAGLLVNWASMSLQFDNKRTLLKIDIQNAFNAVDRGAVLRAVKKHPTLGCLYPMACAWSRSADVLLGPGLRPASFKSRSGQTQGYPPAGLFFAIALQPFVERLDHALGLIDHGEARFYLDDGHIIANLSDPRVFDAVMVFAKEIKEELNLDLNILKYEAFCPNPNAVARDPRWDGPLGAAVEVVEGEAQPGCKVMGVPLGCDAYVHRHLAVRTAKCVSRIKKVTASLRIRSSHALWSATWYCNTALMHHWLQLCPPHVTLQFAADVDVALRHAAIASVVALRNADDLAWRRFQLPARLGGGGLRTSKGQRHAAWLGGVCGSVPRFLSSTEGGRVVKGFSPWCALAFSPDAFSSARGGGGLGYAALFGSVAFGGWIQSSWEHARREAGWLQGEEGAVGRPVDGVLEATAATMGLCLDDQETSGSMQSRITSEIERRQHAVLNEEFLALGKGDIRRVTWLNVDSFSSQWVSSWMGEGEMSNMEFEWVTGTYMALPLPMLQSLVGRKFVAGNRNLVMDAHGHSMMVAALKGGSWLANHDAFLRAVRDVLVMCGVRVQLEPRGLFRQCLHSGPLRGAFDAVLSSQRRSIIPDAAAALTFEEGGPEKHCLIEVKTMVFCNTRYPPRDVVSRNSGVRARAQAVVSEYTRNARNMDTSLAARVRDVEGGRGDGEGAAAGGAVAGAGVRDQSDGPMSRRMRELGPIYPLCVGAFGEMSEFAETLVRAAAEVGAELKWRRMRCNDQRHCKAILIPLLKQHLGMAGVLGNARCAIARLGIFDAPDGAFGRLAKARPFLRRRRESALDHFGNRRAVRAA